MKTSIYLSNRSVAAVSAEGRSSSLAVARCHRAELPLGLVYNGTVVDTAALRPHIESFLRDLGGVAGKTTLVLDGDAMTSKVLNVPALSPRRMRELISNELTIENPQGFIHDYSVISRHTEQGGGRIFALCAERAQIEPFAGLFADCGVLLRGIDVSQSCAMRFFSRAPEYSGMSFICAFADGPDIISMLFIDGEFAFIDRNQLVESRGTPAAAVEISHVLFSMVQYAYAQSGRNPLRHAFISGLLGEEAQFYSEIGDALGLSVGPVAQSATVSFAHRAAADIGPYLFCLGDLMG